MDLPTAIHPQGSLILSPVGSPNCHSSSRISYFVPSWISKVTFIIKDHCYFVPRWISQLPFIKDHCYFVPRWISKLPSILKDHLFCPQMVDLKTAIQWFIIKGCGHHFIPTLGWHPHALCQQNLKIGVIRSTWRMLGFGLPKDFHD